jgi:indolepyruvate ferredoxin oxidoreductase beta subunit
MATKNILLVGVGGQGTVLASTILTKGLIQAGYDVKMSEIHGMAQRGGSVSTQVRFGEKVISSVFGAGEADILVSFETMEALRYLDFLKPDAVAIVNDEQLPSALIQAGLAKYPKGILEELSSKVETKVIKAAQIARGLGNEKVMNIVLFGALAKIMDLQTIDWPQVIRETVKPKFIEINLKAFAEGQALVK